MKIIHLLFIVTIFIVLTSCDNDDEDDNTITPTSGAIKGKVTLYDEGTVLVDNFGMTVSIEETEINAGTDGAGNFTLISVPFGNYTLIYEKEGYGTYKRFDVDHRDQSTTLLDNPSLGQTSSTTITDLTVSSENNTITIGAVTNPEASDANRRFIRYFFSTSADVSSENFEAVSEAFEARTTPYNLNLSVEDLEALGFQSGQTVYAKCYGESGYSNQYEDPGLGRTVFPNLNMTSADAVSFEVP